MRVKPPRGFKAPEKVRVYRRHDHYLLQWWDPGQGRTLNERVDGDLLDAFTRAREIDGNLTSLGGSGWTITRLTHTDLADRYLRDLERRADEDGVALKTLNRYRGALQHYRAYTDQHANRGKARLAARVDSDFVRGFTSYLRSPQVNVDADYVLSVVRAMFLWAADPARGNLMPPAFINPFKGQITKRSRRHRRSLIETPPITVSMAADLIRGCDDYQLRLLAPVIFFGLRPSELCLLMYEDIVDGFLNVYCVEELDHTTKGHTDKRLPLPPELQRLIVNEKAPGRRHGLLMQRRAVAGGRETDRPEGLTRAGLIDDYRHRLSEEKKDTARARDRVLKGVIRDAGGVSYKQVYTEFDKVRGKLGWPKRATLRGLRHLFATFTHDAGMPEAYRKFLMGHNPGGDAIVGYTHLAKVREHYDRAVSREFAAVLEALEERVRTRRPHAA